MACIEWLNWSLLQQGFFIFNLHKNPINNETVNPPIYITRTTVVDKSRVSYYVFATGFIHHTSFWIYRQANAQQPKIHLMIDKTSNCPLHIFIFFFFIINLQCLLFSFFLTLSCRFSIISTYPVLIFNSHLKYWKNNTCSG